MIEKDLAASFGMPEITIITDYSITKEIADMCHKMGEARHNGEIAVDLQTYRNKFYTVSDFCFVFINKETRLPVGYFIILPLTDSAIKRYMNHKLSFDIIEAEDLQTLKSEGLFNLFLDTCVMSEQYRTREMAQLFFALLANAIIERAKKMSFCNYVFAEQFKDFTKMICEKFGLKVLKKNDYGDGLISNFYGGIFDYRIFIGLANYGILEFAHENKHAADILSKRKDLWRERLN